MTKASTPQIQLRDIDTIHPYDKNAKTHGDAQVAKIAESIKRFGWRGNPIVVDSEGVIIAGHGRRLAAISLGMKKVPVTVEADMTAEEARAYRLADNRAAISDIDNDILQAELIDLGEISSDLLDGIFDKKELDFAVSDLIQIDSSVFETDLDAVLTEQAETTEKTMTDVAAKRVAVAKVLGFKDVSVDDSIYVTRFIAQLQADSGKQAEAAFVDFLKNLLGQVSN